MHIHIYICNWCPVHCVQGICLLLFAGHIQVCGESCQEILAAADMLQLLPVVAICRQYLIQQLAPDNCVGEMLLWGSIYCTLIC